jgi:hypothetical protein
MTNSQRQTYAPTADSDVVSNGNIFRFGLLTAIHATFVVAFVSLVPEFKQLFAAFGVPLPQFTRVLLHWHAYVALFLAVCATAQIALFVSLMMSRTLPARRRARIVGLANICIAVIVVIAVYAVPMFLLGAPV